MQHLLGESTIASGGYVRFRDGKILRETTNSLVTRTNAIDIALAYGYPVIVMVTKPGVSSHYVVLTGGSGGSYSFLDPGVRVVRTSARSIRRFTTSSSTSRGRNRMHGCRFEVTRQSSC